MNTLRLIENALVVMLALIPVAVGQQTNCKYGATGWVLCGGTVHNAGGDYVEVGQQTKKPQTKVRIDWMTLGGHLPRIGECFQVVDDHEGSSELSQIACPAEPPKVEIVTDSAEEWTVSSEPQNQSTKPTPSVEIERGEDGNYFIKPPSGTDNASWPVDVPAIPGTQECFDGTDKSVPCGYFCKDGSRILWSSFDGKSHWCHKVNP